MTLCTLPEIAFQAFVLLGGLLVIFCAAWALIDPAWYRWRRK